MLKLKPYFDTPPLSQGSQASCAPSPDPWAWLLPSPSPASPPSRPPSFSSSHWTPSLPPCRPLPPRQPPRPPWLPIILVLAAYLLPFHSQLPLSQPHVSLYVSGSIHHQRQGSHQRNQSRLAASQRSSPQNAEFVQIRWCSSVVTRGFGQHKSVTCVAQIRSFCRVIKPPSMPVRICRGKLMINVASDNHNILLLY